MSIGATRRIRRGILSALRPLTGDRSTGSVLATASGSDVVVKKDSFLVPIPASATGAVELSHGRPFRTTAEAIVTSAGVSIPVASVLGGARQNLPSGTRFRWDPPLVGLAAEATADVAITGGADSSPSPGYVREIRSFETLESIQQAQDVFNGQVGPLPALILAYAGSSTLEDLGSDRIREAHRWRIYAITSWGAKAQAIGDEALDLLDAVRSYLSRRSSSYGLVFSAPPAHVSGATRVRVTPTSFVWAVDVETYMGLERTDHRPLEGGSYAEWQYSRIQMSTTTEAQPSPLPVVDVTADMYLGGGAFSQSFSSAFDGGF